MLSSSRLQFKSLLLALLLKTNYQIMKIIRILVMVAIVASVSCKLGQNAPPDQSAKTENASPEATSSENSKYNPIDALTFGVVGPVQEILLSEALLSTTSTEEQGDPWLEDNTLEMAFDEYGRVTLDGLNGCKYVYDQNGNWTERRVTWDEETRDDGGDGDPEISKNVYLERRTIKYYPE